MSPIWVFLHLLGAVVIVGGTIFLTLLRPVADKALAPDVRSKFFETLGKRMALASGIALLVLIVSGNELVRGRFGAWGNVGDLPGGSILFAKLGVLLIVIVLFGIHGPLGAKMRDLRLAGVEPGDGSPEGDRLARMATISRVVQVMLLVGGLTILFLAAKLTTG